MTKNKNARKNHTVPKNYVFLALVTFVGLSVRLFTYPQVYEKGRIVFIETDPYYHMWRVFSFIETFPRTYLFDSFINYPYGSLVGWPPLFDQMIAFFSLVLGLGKPGEHLVETTGTFIPVLFGIFSIISVYFIAKEIFNEQVAVYSSLLLAVMPAHSQVSFLGYTDHHIAEVLFFALAFLFFIKSLKEGSNLHAAISGVMLGLLFLTWIGAPVLAGIILSCTVLQFIIERKSGEGSLRLMKNGIVLFMTALAVMLVFYVWIPWQQSITMLTLSYFQLIYLAVSIILILFLGFTSDLMKNLKWYLYPVLIAAITASLILLFIIGIPSFYESLSNGVNYLLGDIPILKQISEAQPLFFTYDGKFLGLQLFSNPVWYSFTFSFYVGIAGLVWMLYSLRNNPDRSKMSFIVWTLIILTLALLQRRFVYALSLNIAILSGFFMDGIKDKIRSFSLRPRAIFLFFIMALIIPNIAVSSDLSRSPPKPTDDWYDSLVWLRENTPQDGQYGIMTWWDYGNWVLYIGKRPVVANNFQTGGDAAAKFFITPDESRANAIMDERKARYVVLDRRMGLNKFKQDDKLVIKGTFMAVANFAGKDFAVYLDENNLPNDSYFRTMYSRMHVFDGSGLKNYRLIYESNETHFDLFDRPTGNIKIFEYVKGARISGNTSSNGTLFLSGTIITNQNRMFNYTRIIRADAKGYFEFKVPYSESSPYKARLLKGYELKYGNSTMQVDVTESDVMNGNVIKVNL